MNQCGAHCGARNYGTAMEIAYFTARRQGSWQVMELMPSHKASSGKKGCKMNNRMSPLSTNLSWPVSDFLR